MKPIIPVMRTALEQIQGMHAPYPRVTTNGFNFCQECEDIHPCETRKLADEGLADRMARTNQGENND